MLIVGSENEMIGVSTPFIVGAALRALEASDHCNEVACARRRPCDGPTGCHIGPRTQALVTERYRQT